MGVGSNVGVNVGVSDGARVLLAALVGALVDVLTAGAQLERIMTSMDIAKSLLRFTVEFL